MRWQLEALIAKIDVMLRPQPEEVLEMRFADMELSTRVLTILKQQGIETVADLLEIGPSSADALKHWRGFGRRYANEVKEALENLGVKWE